MFHLHCHMEPLEVNMFFLGIKVTGKKVTHKLWSRNHLTQMLTK